MNAESQAAGLKAYLEQARSHNMVPLFREVLADLETPISVFMKLCHDEPGAFLLESVEGGERHARYSFLGCRPLAVLYSKNGVTRIRTGSPAAADLTFGPLAPAGEEVMVGDPLSHLRSLLARYSVAPALPALTAAQLAAAGNGQGQPTARLPRFFGGAVGYLGYDAVRHFEQLPGGPQDDLQLPDAAYMLNELVGVFDHIKHRLYLVVLTQPGPNPEAAYYRAQALLDRAAERLTGPVPVPGRIGGVDLDPTAHHPVQVRSNMTRQQFEQMVRQAKEYIAAGDIFQVVLSQRFATEVQVSPLQLYRVLRSVNPSPYMFYLRFADLKLVGASPEMLVRVEEGVAQTVPIAGTAPRGATEEEDREIEQHLLANEKERAEHIMLVDLGRNDLGRVCEYGSVHVAELMKVERYSHVMHICSYVRGRLQEGKDAFDALAACFPAGTLSGAPKVRAMEIIDELEPTRRATYGGAVGYFGFNGNMDTCITIRTMVMQGETAYIQAGAGIVADSDPTREYEETLHKASGLIRALELAQNGV